MGLPCDWEIETWDVTLVGVPCDCQIETWGVIAVGVPCDCLTKTSGVIPMGLSTGVILHGMIVGFSNRNTGCYSLFVCEARGILREQ